MMSGPFPEETDTPSPVLFPKKRARSDISASERKSSSPSKTRPVLAFMGTCNAIAFGDLLSFTRNHMSNDVPECVEFEQNTFDDEVAYKKEIMRQLQAIDDYVSNSKRMCRLFACGKFPPIVAFYLGYKNIEVAFMDEITSGIDPTVWDEFSIEGLRHASVYQIGPHARWGRSILITSSDLHAEQNNNLFDICFVFCTNKNSSDVVTKNNVDFMSQEIFETFIDFIKILKECRLDVTITFDVEPVYAYVIGRIYKLIFEFFHLEGIPVPKNRIVFSEMALDGKFNPAKYLPDSEITGYVDIPLDFE